MFSIQEVQINVPFVLLQERYLERFARQRLNPEIGFDAGVLDGCPRSRLKAVAERLLGAGVRITLHGPFMDLSAGSPDPLVRQVTRPTVSSSFWPWCPFSDPRPLSATAATTPGDTAPAGRLGWSTARVSGAGFQSRCVKVGAC